MATDISNKLNATGDTIQALLPKGYTVKKPSAYTIPAYMYEVHYEPVKDGKVQRTTMVFRITCNWSVLDDKMHYKGQLITATPEWHTYNTLEEAVQTLCAMHRIGVM